MLHSPLPALFLGVSLLAVPFDAQQVVQPSGGMVLRKLPPSQGPRPVVHVVYDVAHDRIASIETLSPGQANLIAPPCFDNSAIYLDDTYVVTDPGQELVNWGFKNCPGASRLRSITLLYLSEAQDVAAGGPGGVLQFSLWSGTRGFNRLGTEIFRRTITGLPSGHLVSPTTFLTLDFGANPLPLPDGNIGWGFLQLDGDTGPVLVTAPNVLIGTVDAMDIYSPGPAQAATYLGTFNYGGSGTICHCANTFIQLDEIANNEVASTTVLNGSGVNPQILEELFPPRIGQLWAVRVDVPNPCPGGTLCSGNPDFTILFLSAGNLAAPLASPYGEVLIDPSQRLSAPLLGEGAYFRLLPSDISLVGVVLYAQAATLPPASPTVALTNALRLRVGY